MTSRLFRLSAECLRGRFWWEWGRLLLSVEVRADESMLSADIGRCERVGEESMCVCWRVAVARLCLSCE